MFFFWKLPFASHVPTILLCRRVSLVLSGCCWSRSKETATVKDKSKSKRERERERDKRKKREKNVGGPPLSADGRPLIRRGEDVAKNEAI